MCNSGGHCRHCWLNDSSSFDLPGSSTWAPAVSSNPMNSSVTTVDTSGQQTAGGNHRPLTSCRSDPTVNRRLNCVLASMVTTSTTSRHRTSSWMGRRRRLGGNGVAAETSMSMDYRSRLGNRVGNRNAQQNRVVVIELTGSTDQ